MNIELDSENGFTLHLSSTGKEGLALCGRETRPTVLAITCWKRYSGDHGDHDNAFCEICDSLKNG